MPKITDLGEKLDSLEGVIGFSLPTHRFANREQAIYLGIAPEQMSRKRSGTVPISHAELSKFVQLYQLGPNLDYRIFEASTIDEFLERLRSAKIGTYGFDQQGINVRQRLLNDENRKKGGITIAQRSTRIRGGGLGYAAESPNESVRLHVGNYATLEIDTPGTGYLIVLNDNLQGEILALRPSMFSPEKRVKHKVVKVPEPEEHIQLLSINPPPGWYRIYAIWTTDPIPLERADERPEETPPVSLNSTELWTLTGALDAMKMAGKPYEIRTADYSVVE